MDDERGRAAFESAQRQWRPAGSAPALEWDALSPVIKDFWCNIARLGIAPPMTGNVFFDYLRATPLTGDAPAPAGSPDPSSDPEGHP